MHQVQKIVLVLDLHEYTFSIFYDIQGYFNYILQAEQKYNRLSI